MEIQRVETLIVGAGLIGSSVAMHLAQKGMSGIRVIDLDLEGSLSSSELNAGGVRATWVHPLNIDLSKATIEYLEKVAEDVGYRACGYLWLHPENRVPAALAARDKQIAKGWPVEVWDLDELKRRVPFIDKTEGIGAAFFAPRDGLVNPNLLKNHFREKAKAKGVVFDDRAWLREVRYEAGTNEPIRCTIERFEAVMSHESKLGILTSKEKDSHRSREEYRAKRIINCSGAWAAQVAKILGYRSSSQSVRRQACIFDCREVDLTPYGMIVDTSGVYFHPEATNGLAGFATHETPGMNYNYDGEKFFMEVIWPALYERSTAFERLKHVTGWAGLYETSPDDCAIIGEVDLGSKNLKRKVFEAHSFSGHGVMQSYSAGLALAEKITEGRYETFDVEPLSGSRFDQGRLMSESLVI